MRRDPGPAGSLRPVPLKERHGLNRAGRRPTLRRAAPALGLLALSLAACQEDAPQVVPLEPRAQLIRLSMDLRGRHPTEAELQAIESHPELYDQFVDRYLQSQDFLDRMMEIFNLAFQTRTGDTYFDPAEYGLDGIDENALARAVGEEPLRLIRHIIENDLPYSEVVTAPYTMTNDLLAVWWGIDYPAGASGWIPSNYQDGRPEAGVLTQTTLWERYPSAGGNANRHRANAISRILLCDDFLSRPIVLNRTAIDLLTSSPEDAIRTTDSCQACHSSLDPLAANLFGFFHEARDGESKDEAIVYRPENELGWKDYSGRSPGYFGRPTAGIGELGQSIAEDPRFLDCAVETVFEGLTQRTATEADWQELQGYRSTFELDDQNIRTLVRQIVRSDYYKARIVNGDDALGARLATVKIASPLQLARVIEDATGYRWTFDGQDCLADNAKGLAVLAGGIDSRTVRTRAASPSLGLALVQERLAQAAAWSVVSRDFDPERTGEAKLMCCVSSRDTPETAPDAFKSQIRSLYLAITGLPLADDATEPGELIELWSNVYSVSASTTTAWSAVVSAVLRDPAVVFY